MVADTGASYDLSGDLMDKYSRATWRIIPASTPPIIRRCSKCNRKIEYNCSEKFRVNANQARVDIWLIYKCSKCDSTWKLTIEKGIRPRDVPAALFEQFINNDKSLAWQYAFDRHFLKQNACMVDYASVDYSVEGSDTVVMSENHPEAARFFASRQGSANDAGKVSPLLVRLECPYVFELKLSALLAKALCISVGQVRKLVESGAISAGPDIDIMKYRIKSNLEIFIHGPLVL